MGLEAFAADRRCLGLTLTVAGAAFWLARQHDPSLGEPVVHLRIEPVDLRTTASTTPAETISESALDEDPAPPGEVVIEGLETTETETAVVVAPPVRLTPAPARGFFEKGPDGPLPKIARDGRRPFDVYSRPVHKAVLDSGQPKIAILLGGMGLNGELTRRAGRDLPGEVTFAFAPYGEDLQTRHRRGRGMSATK